jgi:ketosteroid isomerase-like protein
MIRTNHLLLTLLLAATGACGVKQPADRSPATGETARIQVEATERAFAQTMADRDMEAFRGFLADEAVFFTGPQPLRGVEQVAGYWQRFYEAPQPPFSWEPDQVVVLESGALALSTGAVRDPEGRLISRFVSIWRQEAPGVWRIVFDRGEPLPNP